LNAKIDTVNIEEMLMTDRVMQAVDILTHVTSSLDYLEDTAEEGMSSLLTILHAEVSRAIDMLGTSPV